MFYALFVCGHYFFKMGYFKFAFSAYFFRKLVFCLSVFYVFCVMSFEFDVMFIELQHNVTPFIYNNCLCKSHLAICDFLLT